MKIRIKLLVTVIISVFLIACILTGAAVQLYTDNSFEYIEEILQVAVDGYTDDVNYLKKQGSDIEITVFTGDTRTESSIEGVVGSKADHAVIEAVILNGEEYFTEDIVVGGTDFCGYYRPTEDGMLFAGRPRVDFNESRIHMVGIMVGAAAIISIITIVVCYVILSAISKRIGTVQDNIKAVSEGNLLKPVTVYEKTGSIELKEKEHDETRLALHDIVQLKKSLTDIVTTIKDDADALHFSNVNFANRFNEIKGYTDNVNTAVEEIATGATSQAEDAIRVTEKITDMGEVVNVSGQTVQDLSAVVDSMNQLSGQTKQTLDSLNTITQDASEKITTVYEQTELTNRSANQIRKAVEMIQDIASQTNLLSLNASIEAARAGEAGKGFAVVADEIRNLADSSSHSAAEIEQILTELIGNSNKSVEEMNMVLDSTKTQAQGLIETQNAFEALQNEIDTVASAAVSIKEQMDQLVQVKDVLADVAENLSAVSEENAASAQETSAIMQNLASVVEKCIADIETLNELSNELTEQVSVFQV